MVALVYDLDYQDLRYKVCIILFYRYCNVGLSVLISTGHNDGSVSKILICRSGNIISSLRLKNIFDRLNSNALFFYIFSVPGCKEDAKELLSYDYSVEYQFQMNNFSLR